MKTKRNRWLQKIAAWVCVFSFLCPALTVRADDLDSMESQSSGLQSELDGINGELLKIGEEIAENEVELEAVNNDIIKTEEQLLIAKNNEDAHYTDMKARIQYIYENPGENLLGMIFASESLADFVNRVHFVQTLGDYDQDMFDQLQELRYTIEDEEEYLKEQQESCLELEKDLDARRAELNAKAQETSTNLDELEAKIEELKAQRQAESIPVNNQTNNSSGSSDSNSGSSNSGNSGNENQGGGNSGSSDNGSSTGGGYIYPSGPGQLNPWVGVVYFNGHRETYYSQKVLPGGGLNIPGRHVAQDGTVRDANGYLCLASSDYPKGTLIETSLGTGVVYDSGCASGTVDIYTDW